MKGNRTTALRWVLNLVLTGVASLGLLTGANAETTIDVKSCRVSFSPRGEGMATILGELDRAERSVDVAMFYLGQKDLIDSLCAVATKKGVNVRLFVDEEMATPAQRPILERLASRGVKIYVERLPNGGKLHLKCAVVDGRTVITGAANWTSYGFDQNYEDTIILDSPALAARYQEIFNRITTQCDVFEASKYWVAQENQSSASNAGGEAFNPKVSTAEPQKEISELLHVEAYFTPGRAGIGRFLEQARAATKEIVVGMYFIDDREVILGLTEIARAGRCRIRLLVDGMMLSGRFLPYTQQLADAGIKISYLADSKASLHLKTAVIDGKYVWTGSANWSTGALDLNVEDMVMFESPQMAQLYLTFLDDIADHCKSYATFDVTALTSGPRPATPSTRVDLPQQPALPTTTGNFLVGLPPTGPRTDFRNTIGKAPTQPFTVRATVEYLDDAEYFPVLLELLRSARQSILITMFEIPERKERQEPIEQVLAELTDAATRGVYVYMVLHMPGNPKDALQQAHSNLAQRLRAQGIDVRLNVPAVGMHAKMIVVDLAKVIIGTHNWSAGALTGDRVYESSVLLVLPKQDFRFADYILSRNVVSDMRSRELWEREIALLCHVDSLRGADQEALIHGLNTDHEETRTE